jgi:MarR family transcriptional regulator, organic hydroperoxide resistance regulator
MLIVMEKVDALRYVREFLRLYWANEQAHEEWSRSLEARHNLTAKQYALLQALRRADDITTTSLTELLGKAQPAITQMLNRLVRNGYVVRVKSTTDARMRKLHLTRKALNVLKDSEPVGPTRVALVLEHATPREAAQTVRSMAMLHEWMTRRPLGPAS